MKNNTLPVSEKFYSIQGEGRTMGTPSVFVRLGGCNLLCKSDHWKCDTIDVWKKSKKTAFEDILCPQDIQNLFQRGAHLIFTGGEPLLHQDKILDFLKWLHNRHQTLPTIEIETNGTIIPSVDWDILGNHLDKITHVHFNVSPKLASSGEALFRRMNHKALSIFNHISSITATVNFKFVISSMVDFREMHQKFTPLLSESRISLMPAGANQTELEKNRKMVVDLCLEYGYHYSDRLHVVIWNQATGV